MDEPTVVTEVDVALERYTLAMSAIESALSQLPSDWVLEVLLARDGLRAALENRQFASTPQIVQLIELDNRLQERASAIAVAPLDEWRSSRQPPEDAWWWFLQPPVENQRWNRLDWIWNGLASGALALAASFIVSIFQALSVDGLSWAETFSTIAQGAGLALVGQGALTETGQQKVRAALAHFKIPPHFNSEVTCMCAFLLLLMTFGLHKYLPNYFYDRGQVYYEQGQLMNAEEEFIHGQSIEPSDPRFNLALGAVYESLGSLEQALAQYQQALGQGVARAFNNIGRIYINRFNPVKKRTEPIVAETYLRLGLQRVESDATADKNTRFQLHRNLGWALISQKRYAEAKIELEQAVANDVEVAGKQIGGGMEACFLAQVYEQEGDLQRAVGHWNQCRDFARPETINEYKWFLRIGQYQLANCIDTSSIVSGLMKLPRDFNTVCQGEIEQLVRRNPTVSIAALRVVLQDRLTPYWNGSDQLDQALVYRVSVELNGAITAYEPLNETASKYVQYTPLPALTKSDISTQPTTDFKVVFRPAGAFDISVWQ